MHAKNCSNGHAGAVAVATLAQSARPTFKACHVARASDRRHLAHLADEAFCGARLVVRFASDAVVLPVIMCSSVARGFVSLRECFLLCVLSNSQMTVWRFTFGVLWYRKGFHVCSIVMVLVNRVYNSRVVGSEV